MRSIGLIVRPEPAGRSKIPRGSRCPSDCFCELKEWLLLTFHTIWFGTERVVLAQGECLT